MFFCSCGSLSYGSLLEWECPLLGKKGTCGVFIWSYGLGNVILPVFSFAFFCSSFVRPWLPEVFVSSLEISGGMNHMKNFLKNLLAYVWTPFNRDDLWNLSLNCFYCSYNPLKVKVGMIFCHVPGITVDHRIKTGTGLKVT